MSAGSLAFEFPESLVEAIAERAAELVLERLRAEQADDEASEWIHGDKALAAYLGWPLGRTQKRSKAGAIPCRRVGQRKSYRRSEVDEWLEAYREGPPRLRLAE